MAPPPRESSSKSRRRSILDAALECFTEHGVAETTMAAIRAGSGASTGSIYHHFRDKEDLAVALFLDSIERYHEALLTGLAATTTANAAVHAVVETYLSWVAAHPKRARFIHQVRRARVVTGREESVRDSNRRFLRAVSDTLIPYVNSGEIVALPKDLYAPVLVGPAHEFARQWLAGTSKTSIEDASDALAAAAWRAIRA